MTQSSSGIGRITTQGAITFFPLSANAYPQGLTIGPDKVVSALLHSLSVPSQAMWFCANSFIGRITTAGVATSYYGLGGCFDIATDASGALWMSGSSAINRVSKDLAA